LGVLARHHLADREPGAKAASLHPPKLGRFIPLGKQQHPHLSLQSGSDTVLKRMNRHYTAPEYENACRLLRSAYELPSLNTDIIVGFPGETEEEFNETMEFARRIGFAKIHIFKYSRRKGTFADKMPGQIDEEIKSRRSELLSRTDELNHREYIGNFIGKKVRILTEQEDVANGERYMTGLTERYVRVGIKDCGIPQNTFVECLVTGITDQGILIGERLSD
ncbi:MAG: radical SAM protein, partial [Lachnospiraceae bacterium]|nr:radical SAM protein [Lachnospiraceae bacterium]